MIKVQLSRNEKSGHSEYDYLALLMTPEEALAFAASVIKQASSVLKTGADSGREEPRFNGRMIESGKPDIPLGGFLSVMIDLPLHCAHPGCPVDFHPTEGVLASARQPAGYLCERHDPAKGRG